MQGKILYQTVFHIEKLRNVVNVGSSSAYHIDTSPGPALGWLGALVGPDVRNSANESSFNPSTVMKNKGSSWINRALAYFRRP